MGQWVGNKHNYSFADMRRNQSHCIRLDQIRADPNNGVKFAKPHPKGESIWERQYDRNFTKQNLKDYPSSEEVVASWKQGIVLARELAISVGMKPSKDYQSNLFPPYEVENADHWFFDPLSAFKKTDIEEEYGDEDDDETGETDETAIDDETDVDFSVQQVEAFGENIEVLPAASAINHLDILGEGSEDTTTKKVPKVIIPDSKKEIYKATLVQLMNDDPKLSHDRLQRVRQRNEYKTGTSTSAGGIDERRSVALYNDYAFVDRIQSSYIIGRVERILFRDGKKKVDYTRPEPFDSVVKNNLSLTVSFYEKCGKGWLQNKSTLRTVPFKDAFSEVDLVLEDDCLVLEKDAENVLVENLHKLFSTNKKIQVKQRETINERNDTNFETIDGKITVEVTPMDSSDSGLRRSTRKRKMIIYDD
ncbi:uncharacterized protein [Clytia hemisphaerica]|uniref:uncharacterized protein n=1 Tax=Clytia hemisphaerica TaxID=252671 RepID=UPI0034D3BED8